MREAALRRSEDSYPEIVLATVCMPRCGVVISMLWAHQSLLGYDMNDQHWTFLTNFWLLKVAEARHRASLRKLSEMRRGHWPDPSRSNWTRPFQTWCKGKQHLEQTWIIHESFMNHGHIMCHQSLRRPGDHVHQPKAPIGGLRRGTRRNDGTSTGTEPRGPDGCTWARIILYYSRIR